jgi:hypothetical protein
MSKNSKVKEEDSQEGGKHMLYCESLRKYKIMVEHKACGVMEAGVSGWGGAQ